MTNKKRLFEVTYSIPPKDPSKNWRLNKSCLVLTTDAREAIALVLEQEPDADVWQVNHKGMNANFIIDPRFKDH